MKLPTGDSSFFPSYYRTERGATLVIEPISLTKDHEIRRRIDTASERGPGLPLVLGGPDIMKALAVCSTDVAEDLFEITAFILDVSAEFVGTEMSLPETVEIIMSCVYTPTDETDEERVDSGDIWTFARLVDFLSKEYSWTIPIIMGMSRHQLKTVLKAVEERQADEKKAYEDAKDENSAGGGLRTAKDRMENTNLLNKVDGKAKHRKKMKKGDDGKPEPDWETSEGSNSLKMFAHTLGIKIKKEGNVSA